MQNSLDTPLNNDFNIKKQKVLKMLNVGDMKTLGIFNK
jgi:hypothetical protein